MNFSELMSLCNGNYIETAGTSAKNQCVDIVNAYIRYILGLPVIEYTNAVDFPSKAGDAYEYVLNTPTGIPKEGDIVIWGGTYGHVAIFIEGNASYFTSFDQNFPVGSPCHVQQHNYSSPKVLGWLHPKNPPSDTQNQLDQCRTDRDTNHNDRIALWEELGFTGKFVRLIAVERIKSLKVTEEDYQRKEEQLKLAQGEIGTLEKRIEILRKEHDEFAISANETIQKQDGQLRELTENVEELKKQTTVPELKGWKKILYDLLIR